MKQKKYTSGELFGVGVPSDIKNIFKKKKMTKLKKKLHQKFVIKDDKGKIVEDYEEYFLGKDPRKTKYYKQMKKK